MRSRPILNSPAADHRANGLSHEEARVAALRRFGGVTQTKEAVVRDGSGFPALDALWIYLRYGISTLRRVPIFTVVWTDNDRRTGVTTAIVSLGHAVLLQPLPYPDSDHLVVLVNTWQGHASLQPYTSAPRLQIWRTHATGLRDVATYAPAFSVTVTADSPQQAVAERVTASFFSYLAHAWPEGGRSPLTRTGQEGRRSRS